MEPITTVFLILTTACVSIWAFENPAVEARLVFRPERILADKEYDRLVTSSFLHAGWGHLLLNMYALSSLGGTVERLFGPAQFLLIYFGSVIGGDLLSLYLHRYHDYAAYGASGGVCGLLFAYILKFPHVPMSLFPLPYTVPAWFFGIAFTVATFYALKAGKDNIGHDAHLGGAMIGLLILAWLHPELVRRHWMVFTTLLLIAGLMFLYLLKNPLFLPLSSFISLPSKAPRARRTSATSGGRATRSAAPQRIGKDAQAALRRHFQPDWLIAEIEVQVGSLVKDTSGKHDWLDKFGRSYDVLGGSAAEFNLQSFVATLMERLNTPAVRFVIVDTRQLTEAQVNLLRPVIADLPEAQFNRVIRSYAFKPR